jgi:hypothetical protein
MESPEDTYVIHLFTMLLAFEIRERSLMWSDHNLVRNRGVAVEFLSRMQEVPEEVLESCLPGYSVDCITWVATRIKASQEPALSRWRL